MVVGTGLIILRLHDCRSLKGKRKVVKAMISRLRNNFNLSVAEVGANDIYQRAEIGFSLVGVYLTTLNGFDLYLMLGLALLALALRWFGFPLAPLLLGFILSGLLEENARRTLFIAEGGFDVLLDRPAFLLLAGLVVVVWLVPLWQRFRRRRD